MTSEQKYKQLGADYHWQWAQAGDANPYVRWLKRVLAHLPEAGQGATLLDWGCGDGYPASLLAARGFDVTGVDVYEPALDVARERVPGGGLRCRARTCPKSLITFWRLRRLSTWPTRRGWSMPCVTATSTRSSPARRRGLTRMRRAAIPRTR